MDSNIYSEEIKLNAYYTYDKNLNKVYDTKGIKKRISEIIKNLKYLTWVILLEYGIKRKENLALGNMIAVKFATQLLNII